MSGDPFPILTQIQRLTRLRISANSFDGSLPPTIAAWDRMVELWLAENSFSGVLPEALGELVNLQTLFLYDNQFSGPLPTTLGNLRLFAFQAHRNRLDGEIPPQFYNNVDLTFLRLDENQFSGSLTGNFGRLTELEDLRLSNNSFTGPLLPSFYGLNKLREFPLLPLTSLCLLSHPLNFRLFCHVVQEMWFCDTINSRVLYVMASAFGKTWTSSTSHTIILGDSSRHRFLMYRLFVSSIYTSTTFKVNCPIITANRHCCETFI